MVLVLLINKIKTSHIEVWTTVVMLVWWNIWKARNAVIFQGEKVDQDIVLSWIKSESLSNCINHNLIATNIANQWYAD